MLVSAIRQERSSPTFCNYFSQQIPYKPKHSNPQEVVSMLGDNVLWKLHKEQHRTLPSILSCHQYPFGWLLTFLCGRWHLLTTHHLELQYNFV